MKSFEKTDLAMQTLLIVGLLIITLLKQDVNFIAYSYFIVGGWQVLSMLVHQLNKWHIRKGSRRYYYHRFSLAVTMLMAVSFIITPLLFVWYIMLFGAPVMALYYLSICYREVFYPAKRPLELI